jgi:hypothetical protein
VKACLIDFGLKAIGKVNFLPPDAKVGDLVVGQIKLGLPISTEIAPTVAYRWTVKGITADVTPFIQHPERKYFFRDASNVLYKEVPATSALNASSYILHFSNGIGSVVI